MPGYRLYFTDADGHITSAAVIEARTDEEALAEADRLRLGLRCELWLGGIPIHSFDIAPILTDD